jgi:hypothetical protein
VLTRVPQYSATNLITNVFEPYMIEDPSWLILRVDNLYFKFATPLCRRTDRPTLRQNRIDKEKLVDPIVNL